MTRPRSHIHKVLEPGFEGKQSGFRACGINLMWLTPSERKDIVIRISELSSIAQLMKCRARTQAQTVCLLRYTLHHSSQVPSSSQPNFALPSHLDPHPTCPGRRLLGTSRWNCLLDYLHCGSESQQRDSSCRCRYGNHWHIFGTVERGKGRGPSPGNASIYGISKRRSQQRRKTRRESTLLVTLWPLALH